MENYTRKTLLGLPSRPWAETKTYHSLLLFPSGKKHDSGRGCMSIFGCISGAAVEIITTGSDDISITGNYRIDCLHSCKAFHFWGSGISFQVGAALSSINVRVIDIAQPSPNLL